MPWLEQPSLEEGFAFLAEHAPNLSLGRRALLLVGRFRVDYQGRAESRLPSGDRILLIKPDGALMIHNPTGFKPVNWQPPGCQLSILREGTSVVVRSERHKPPELLTLVLERIELAGVTALEEAPPLDLRGTEAELRDTLRARPELIEAGFVPWARERQTERGPMDLYGEDARGRRVIIEVKRVPAGLAEATQLWRYVEKERTKRSVDVRGILVAPSVSERARALLRDHGLEFREIGIEELRRREVPLATRGQSALTAYGDPDA